MTKAERLLFIVNMFRVRKTVTLDELAQECEVSTRTVYRDLLSLSSLNIPVYFHDGYRLARDISLPPLNFTQDEQELLGFSLKNSCLIQSPHICGKLRNIELKILSVLPEKKKGGLNHLLQNLRCGSEKFSDVEDAIIRIFLSGLFDKKEMEVTLKRDNRTFRDLTPQSLQIRGKKWILCFLSNPDGKIIKISIDKVAEIRVK